eukprot:TRINITY_DN42670_c0_g1_i1.p1 TRINITY_DN42670_c0_g1~~TRINITY_DN42670_c0_g1_i1.p1  ORF type:complete len:215 (-),score=62.40 TRINITY_DN42670_c0_g1_i1:64-684(-)
MRVFLLSLLVCYSSAAPAIFETAEQVARSVFSLAQRYEEAPYTSTQIDREVQERVYPSRKWVCTKMTADDQSESVQGTMFWRLFGYINGENSEEKKMPMTVPVSTKVTGAGPVELEMCFYVNNAEQSNPPAPTNPEVYIQEASRTIYTRTIGGYMDTRLWKEEAQDLNNKLTELSLNFDTSSYWKVGYDAPFKFWNRRNEIWYLKA